MRGLVEVVPIQDVFCSGLGAIEKLAGNCYRFYLYASQVADDGHQDKVLVAKLVMPASGLPDAVLQTMAAMNEHSVGIIPLVAEVADMAH